MQGGSVYFRPAVLHKILDAEIHKNYLATQEFNIAA